MEDLCYVVWGVRGESHFRIYSLIRWLKDRRLGLFTADGCNFLQSSQTCDKIRPRPFRVISYSFFTHCFIIERFVILFVEGMVKCIINNMPEVFLLSRERFILPLQSRQVLCCHAFYIVYRRCRSSPAWSRLPSADSRMVDMQGQRNRIAAWIICTFQTYVFRISWKVLQKECCNKWLAWLLFYAEPGAMGVVMCWLIRPVAHFQGLWQMRMEHWWEKSITLLEGGTAPSSLFIIRYPVSDRTRVFTVWRWRPADLERGTGAPAICIVILVSINIANVWKTAVLITVRTI
jgi:hypothetical protein